MESDGPVEELRCSFCAKPQAAVRKLIAGPPVFICDQCVQVCVAIIANDDRRERLKDSAASEQSPPECPPSMPDLLDYLAEISARRPMVAGDASSREIARSTAGSCSSTPGS
jgi:hypothetical protein